MWVEFWHSMKQFYQRAKISQIHFPSENKTTLKCKIWLAHFRGCNSRFEDCEESFFYFFLYFDAFPEARIGSNEGESFPATFAISMAIKSHHHENREFLAALIERKRDYRGNAINPVLIDRSIEVGFLTKYLLLFLTVFLKFWRKENIWT